MMWGWVRHQCGVGPVRADRSQTCVTDVGHLSVDSRELMGRETTGTTVLDVARQAQEHFFSIQSLEATLAVLQARGDLLRRLHDLAESKLRIGESTKLDLITIQAQQVQFEAEIAERNIELRNERLALARLIGQPDQPQNGQSRRGVNQRCQCPLKASYCRSL
ncbi:MAG: hypothetical protein KatS3mg104_0273 [Phycisphaerae bacterium]|nr:MAG: hypothetical protein KatS3mg104_0273 [Phycisphaerae bacterium]